MKVLVEEEKWGGGGAENVGSDRGKVIRLKLVNV
jgi:hypothetical protein